MKIRFLAEVLRYKKGFSINQGWFDSVFSNIIKAAVNVCVDELGRDELENIKREIFHCYRFHDIPKEGWFELYNADVCDKLLDIVNVSFKNSFIIAFELHPLLQKAFDVLNIPYIKMMWHPVRYMDDIFFGMASNEERVYSKILKYKVDEFLFMQHASILRAEARLNEWCRRIRVKENSCVFFAQSNVDCSLIRGNSMLNFFDFRDEFLDDIKSYDHVYFKIHPVNRNEEVIKFIRTIRKAEILYPLDIDFYDLLASTNIRKCLAISSGSLYEARFFGKEIKYYYKQPFMFVNDYGSEQYKISDTFIPIYKTFWQPKFWADILSDHFSPCQHIPEVHEEYSNKLRRMLRMSWGYNDCDSVYARTHITKLEDEIRNIGQKSKRKLRRRKCYNFFVRLIASFLLGKQNRRAFRKKYLK